MSASSKNTQKDMSDQSEEVATYQHVVARADAKAPKEIAASTHVPDPEGTQMHTTTSASGQNTQETAQNPPSATPEQLSTAATHAYHPHQPMVPDQHPRAWVPYRPSPIYRTNVYIQALAGISKLSPNPYCSCRRQDAGVPMVECSNGEERLDGWYQAASVKLKILPGRDGELRSLSKRVISAWLI